MSVRSDECRGKAGYRSYVTVHLRARKVLEIRCAISELVAGRQGRAPTSDGLLDCLSFASDNFARQGASGCCEIGCRCNAEHEAYRNDAELRDDRDVGIDLVYELRRARKTGLAWQTEDAERRLTSKYEADHDVFPAEDGQEQLVGVLDRLQVEERAVPTRVSGHFDC